MKFKNRRFIFSILGMLVLFMGSGYLLGKWVVGRRGDLRKEIALSEVAPISKFPVATATDENTLPVLTQTSTELPESPFLVSWCEGKNCDHRFTKKIICSATLYADAREDSKSIVEVKPGDEIETRIYYTKVLKVGSYLPLEAPKRTIVTHADRNLWVTFHDQSWDSAEWPSDVYEKNPVYQIAYPETESWTLIKLKTGPSGFLKITNTHSKSCPFALSSSP
jgi:hypothetical protein